MKRPFVYVTLSLSAGIFLAPLLKIPFNYSFGFTLAFIISAVLYHRKEAFSHACLYLAIFFFGMCIYLNSDILAPDHISNYTTEGEEKVILKGVITDDPVISDTFYGHVKTSFLLNVDSLKRGSVWRKAEGLTKVDIYKNVNRFNYGDEVILEGLLSRPNRLRNGGIFDYSKYLENKNIYSCLKVKNDYFAEAVGAGGSNPVKKTAYRLRHKIAGILDAALAQPFSGFMKAVLIGDRSGLKESLKEDFIKTGTVHVLAISGLHVGLIATIFLAVFGILRIPKKFNLILTSLALIFYSYVAGSSPPILRATIIFCIFVLGYLMDREADMLNSLSVAALLILLFNPKTLYDPGFQLSFMSVLSIIILTPGLEGLLMPGEMKRGSMPARAIVYILKSISVSMAAWIGVAPIVSLYFNVTSPIAIIANIIIIPALFLSIVFSFTLLFLSMMSNTLAVYVAVMLSGFDNAVFFMNALLARVPFSYFRTPAPSSGFFIVYYGALICLTLPRDIVVSRIRVYKKYVLIAALLFFNIFTLKGDMGGQKNVLKVTFLDVGQGDSAFIEFPAGGNLLIDGGSGGEEEKFDIGKSVIAPYLWNKGVYKIDAIMATHFHEDHLGGIIYLLKNFDVGCVIDNGAMPEDDNKIHGEYEAIIKERNIRHIIVGEGDELGPFGGARLFVLNPEKNGRVPDSNDNSIVVKLVYGNSNVLFTADITSEAIERLSSYNGFLKSDILKFPHHGGSVRNEDALKKFIREVSPKISVISVGRNNQYKAPSKKTLNIITSSKSISYETKDAGLLEVILGTNYFKLAGVEKN